MPKADTITVLDACTAFLAQHEASDARRTLLRAMLAKACDAFGNTQLDSLTAVQLSAWRTSMPAPTRWQATQALKQVSAWAARWQLTECDALAGLANPRPWRGEVRPLTSWTQVERIAGELPARLELLPILGAGCGLRPGELLGLDWSSVDLARRTLTVRQSVYEGELRATLKTRRSRREVPIRARVAEALHGAVSYRDSDLVLTSARGGVVNLRNLRAREWRRALSRAGVDHPHRIYDLRHTYATWSLRAGLDIYQLARRMGTSVAMIDATYGHLAADAAEHERSLLDAWDGR
jgi:integrase